MFALKWIFPPFHATHLGDSNGKVPRNGREDKPGVAVACKRDKMCMHWIIHKKSFFFSSRYATHSSYT